MAVVEISDVLGLGKPLKKLISVVSKGAGTIYKPYLIKKTARAKAYELKLISDAITETSAQLKKIDYKDKKISLSAIDEEELKAELNIEERQQSRNSHVEQKRQINLENIVQVAAENIEDEEIVSEDDVDEDWISRFFDYAKDISSEEMQAIWGRILSGEVKEPNSFSLRTLETLRNLSKEEAQIFSKVAKYAIQKNDDYFLFKGGKDHETLDQFELTFSDVFLLQELNLIHSSDSISLPIGGKKEESTTIFIFGETVLLVKKEPNEQEKIIRVYKYTYVGQQLLKLIKIDPEIEYLRSFAKFVKTPRTKIQYAKFISQKGLTVSYQEPLKDFPMDAT
jgi:uncharacterized repeat protein (TIGR03899 family)